MACDAQSLVNTAYQNGYPKLSEIDLWMAIVASACAASPAGGGGGNVSCGVIDPAGAPVSGCGFYYNKTTGKVWFWNGATWIVLIDA